MFNDTELDTHRFDQNMNYNYITRFKFCLSLYPLLILTCTPFKRECILIRIRFCDTNSVGNSSNPNNVRKTSIIVSFGTNPLN